MDKVKPLCFESPDTGGTETDYLPTELDPTDDYVSTKGIAFEDADNRKIDLDLSGNIQFQDATQTTEFPLSRLVKDFGTPANSLVASVQATSSSFKQLQKESNTDQVFTGTASGQILRLPDATTLDVGHKFELWNFSEEDVVVQNFAATTLASIKENAQTKIILWDNSTSSGQWALTYTLDGGSAAAVNEAGARQIMFQFMGQMNFPQYLLAGPHVVTGSGFRRSGDPTNGARFANSAPMMSPVTGTVNAVTTNATGVAQSTGSPAAICTLKMELWKVGQSGGEGTLLGNIFVPISSSVYNIGNFGNSSIVTAFGQEDFLSPGIDVEAGDLLGLKFINQTGNSNINSVHNLTVILNIKRELVS
jgi:hypothetical protein